MSRLRWRISAIASGLVLLTLSLFVGAAVTDHDIATQSAGPGTFIWTGSYYKDPVCGSGSESFVMRLLQHNNYGGDSWKICSSQPDFCWVPHGQSSSDATLCAAGYDADTANDYGSSLKVSSIAGGDLCSLRIYENRNYGGVAYTTWDPVNDPSVGVPFNDVFSSIRRVCT